VGFVGCGRGGDLQLLHLLLGRHAWRLESIVVRQVRVVESGGVASQVLAVELDVVEGVWALVSVVEADYVTYKFHSPISQSVSLLKQKSVSVPSSCVTAITASTLLCLPISVVGFDHAGSICPTFNQFGELELIGSLGS
jgi:hypothetical protein